MLNEVQTTNPRANGLNWTELKRVKCAWVRIQFSPDAKNDAKAGEQKDSRKST